MNQRLLKRFLQNSTCHVFAAEANLGYAVSPNSSNSPNDANNPNNLCVLVLKSNLFAAIRYTHDLHHGTVVTRLAM